MPEASAVVDQVDRSSANRAEPSPYRKLVTLPARSTLNAGVLPVNNQLMMALLGAPRPEGDYDQVGKPLTNPKLQRNVHRDDVGPFSVNGLKPAVASLKQVLADVQREQPELCATLGTAGMLVVRNVRGSTTSISNHSWGTAIDLKIDGVLDVRGDDLVQYGLTLLAPIFNRHGWYWGAAYRTEDAMHFEAGRALVEAWAQQIV